MRRNGARIMHVFQSQSLGADLPYMQEYTCTVDEQFLQFCRFGFVTLGPFCCAYIRVCLCIFRTYMCYINIIVTQWGAP